MLRNFSRRRSVASHRLRRSVRRTWASLKPHQGKAAQFVIGAFVTAVIAAVVNTVWTSNFTATTASPTAPTPAAPGGAATPTDRPQSDTSGAPGPLAVSVQGLSAISYWQPSASTLEPPGSCFERKYVDYLLDRGAVPAGIGVGIPIQVKATVDATVTITGINVTVLGRKDIVGGTYYNCTIGDVPATDIYYASTNLADAEPSVVNFGYFEEIEDDGLENTSLKDVSLNRIIAQFKAGESLVIGLNVDPPANGQSVTWQAELVALVNGDRYTFPIFDDPYETAGLETPGAVNVEGPM